MAVRSPVLLLLIAAVLSSCGGRADPCAGIVTDAIEVFQDLVSTVDELDLGDAVAGDDFAVPGMGDIELRLDALQAEAVRLECDDDELRRSLAAGVEDLEARTVFGRALIEGIRQEGLFGE